jgi:DNA primase
MRLGEDFIDEIKARIRPSDLIGRTVGLKRQGKEFAGLSPFKKERTPSFFVNDEKRFYHCFATGKHGDIFTWLEEMEGLSFMEAAERLAGEAGLDLPAPDPEAAQKAEHRKSLVEWMEAAHGFFKRSLKGPEAAEAQNYLKSRGLTGADCVRFGIGYAPESRSALKDELVMAGAMPGELVECGLLIAPDSGAPYDRFRDRIMFPIHDPRGRLVAFGGRALSKEARAKYLNSPETPLFHKGATLYRFPEARRAVSDPKSGAKGLIVTEGYLDAIALARAGMEQGVAPLGTAVTEEQLALLWRAGGEPIMCFDGDSAGRRAAMKSAERALPLLQPGRSLRFAFMPDGKDPDDVLREDGAGALRATFDTTRPLADLLWEREVNAEPLDDPDRRAGFRRRIRTIIGQISDHDIREEYKREFDMRMDAIFGGGQAGGQAGGYRKKYPGRGGKYQPKLGASQSMKKRFAAGSSGNDINAVRRAIPNPNERILLGALLEWPEMVEELLEEIALIPFVSLDTMRDAVLEACSLGPAVSSSELRAELLSRGYAQLLKRVEDNREPMRATLGGADASAATRIAAWRRLAATYMRQSGSQEQREEMRALTEQKISEDDSESLRFISEAYRRENAKTEES